MRQNFISIKSLEEKCDTISKERDNANNGRELSNRAFLSVLRSIALTNGESLEEVIRSRVDDESVRNDLLKMCSK